MPRETIGTAFVRIVAEGKGFGKTVRKELEKEDPAIVSAMEDMGEEHGRAYDKGFTEQIRKDKEPNGVILERLRKSVGKFDAQGRLTAHRFSDGFKKELQKAFGEDIGLGVFNDLKKDVNSGKLAIEDLGSAMDNIRPRVIRVRSELEKMTRELGHHDRLMPGFNRNWGRFADTVGTFSGRGSRNNFLNFIGSMTRNLTNLLGVLPKAIVGFLDFGRSVKDAGGGFKGFAEVLSSGGGISGLLKNFGKGGGALIGLAAGIAAISALVVGPIIAGLSLLLGVITAVASTITFALIGGLVALAGTLLPLIAGFGIVTAAILSMDDAMKKKLSKSIKPLVNEMKRLGDVAAEELFKNAPEQAERLGGIFKGLEPLVRGVARAMSDVVDIFLDMMDSPGFKQFVRAMTKFLPDAVRSLGHIFANTLGGLGGFFVAAIPITRRFLHWMERITGEFNKWANSKSGREELRGFFERAGDSARSLGHFLNEVTSLLATIFSGTNTAGNNIFDSMADNVERFNQFLQDNPDALADWARDAQKFGEKVGEALVAVGKLFDFFDSSGSRKLIIGFFEIMPQLIGSSTFALRLLYEAISGIWRALNRATDAFMTFSDESLAAVRHFGAEWHASWNRNWERLRRFVDGAINGINDFGNAGIRVTRRVGQAIEDFGNAGISITRRLGHAFAEAGRAAWDLYKDVMNGPVVAMRKLGGLIGQIPGLIRNILGLTLRIPGVTAVMRNINDIISGIGSLIGWIESLIGALGRIHFPSAPGWLTGSGGRNVPGVPFVASGGIFNGATRAIIGEAGPEAVVPLNRNLSQVDPAVRALSAFAQGLNIPNMASGGVVGGRSIDASGWTIVSPNDPTAVAQEAVNLLAAAAYV